MLNICYICNKFCSMNIIGRKNELAILNDLIKSKDSEFLAIYGRRRVGKTYLIREFFGSKICFECAGSLEKKYEWQLDNFWNVLKTSFPRLKKSEAPVNWVQAFELLKTAIKPMKSKEKKVIFLDEIGWMDTHKSGFLAALDNFYNQFCTKRKDIILVICGSAASYIINKIIKNKGGLHNRVTSHIKLLPFQIDEAKEYLKARKVKLSDTDIVKLYMCIGGIPYYLNGVKAGQSLGKILENLFFNEISYLGSEFENLYASLFKNHELHVSIISALGKSSAGLSRQGILDKLQISGGGTFSIALEELVQCGFIVKTNAYNKLKESAIYRLLDEYSFFYFKFLANRKERVNGNELVNSQAFTVWCGYSFENFVFRHIHKVAHLLGISGISYQFYSWMKAGNSKNKGAQIDMIIDRTDHCINIVEVKFYQGPFPISKNYAIILENKLSAFVEDTKTKKTIFITMISNAGITQNSHYLSTVTNQFTLSELIN